MALAAWEAGTTYTRGFHFTESLGESILGEPDVGDDAPILRRYGLGLYRLQQFAVERRRGWVESADTPPRPEGGHWDEGRDVTMEEPQPGASASTKLTVRRGYAAFRTMPRWNDPAEYAIEHAGDLIVLDDAQWADWDRNGRLLVATLDGRVQIRTFDGGQGVVWEEDLSVLQPDPQPAPDWASEP